ncbi:MAG: hypothetical protein HOW59_16710, partial [Nonomuraea sp.]|nr:hypothetical protein [Nonomuraea sp.]
MTSDPRPGHSSRTDGFRRSYTPRRVTVTSPRTAAARRPRYPATREIDEQTRLGEV